MSRGVRAKFYFLKQRTRLGRYFALCFIYTHDNVTLNELGILPNSSLLILINWFMQLRT